MQEGWTDHEFKRTQKKKIQLFSSRWVSMETSKTKGWNSAASCLWS